MRKEVWFGTREQMGWVPAPLANYTSANVSWRAYDPFLNGGSGVRSSQTSHKELDLNWGVQSAENLAPLIAALQRPGPYFFCDPINMKTNMVPPYWATPTEDAPPFIPGVVPTQVAGTANTLGYATMASQYVVPTGGKVTALEIPVPEGHTLRLGVHGTGAGNWTFEGKGTTGQGAILAATSTTRTNMTFAGPGFAKLVAPAGTQKIQGIIAQVLPNGVTVPLGGFLPGMGHTALELRDNPSITSYSANIPNAQIGVAANFAEVGAWL